MVVQGLDQLKVPIAVRKDLEDFVSQLLDFYKGDLVSVTVFGSAVSGDYAEATSDLNLLVIYSDLNIADLGAVAKLAQRWLRKRKFMPRFLSLRNLTASSRFFQIDLLEMRDAHVVLYGEDVLAGIPIRPADMYWQLAHEIKRMRMRIKQQFWRAAGDPKLMRLILLQRFSSLVHLLRVLLFLRNKPTPLPPHEVVEAAVRELNVDPEFAREMFAWKAGKAKPDPVGAFSKLMEMIRLIDAEVDRLGV
ncbi:MAG: hypothetical protein ABSE56_13040 [Bryobacteraceae bacterium]|jgi:predicted nucleotidyltransferase